MSSPATQSQSPSVCQAGSQNTNRPNRQEPSVSPLSRPCLLSTHAYTLCARSVTLIPSHKFMQDDKMTHTDTPLCHKVAQVDSSIVTMQGHTHIHLCNLSHTCLFSHTCCCTQKPHTVHLFVRYRKHKVIRNHT